MPESKTIMVVDDDLTLREMYEERLKAEGFVVTGAADGEEAYKKAQEEHPSLIILDIMMPKLNGIDTLKKLRADDKTQDIPVIILTALVQEIDKIKEMMRPNDSYLVKSEEMPKDVVSKVYMALNEGEAKKEEEKE
ncbi:MAG: response regulator [Patescibacteria group bacterium]|jgi:DNA-binding response OmpR family regulator